MDVIELTKKLKKANEKLDLPRFNFNINIEEKVLLLKSYSRKTMDELISGNYHKLTFMEFNLKASLQLIPCIYNDFNSLSEEVSELRGWYLNTDRRSCFLALRKYQKETMNNIENRDRTDEISINKKLKEIKEMRISFHKEDCSLMIEKLSERTMNLTRGQEFKTGGDLMSAIIKKDPLLTTEKTIIQELLSKEKRIPSSDFVLKVELDLVLKNYIKYNVINQESYDCFLASEIVSDKFL